MPFVGFDSYATRKRRRCDDERDERAYGLYSPEPEEDVRVLNQHLDLPRKVLPLSKRARMNGDQQYHRDDHTMPRRRHLQEQTNANGKVKPTAPLMTPCHICQRTPSKKSDFDAFAECEGCGGRTCFICIRECQGCSVDEGSVLSEQKVLSRSFHMHDADDISHDVEEHEDSEGTPHKNSKGWCARGHRRVVCSACCVEQGWQGEVSCLGCLSRMERP